MTTKWPLPRTIPKGVGFGSSHAELFRATQQFLRDVERAEHEGREEADAIQKKFGIPAPYRPTVHVERYSVAVQVFAAMTLEAVIDMYAVVRFGEDEVRSTWTRSKKPLVTKFGEMLEAAREKPLQIGRAHV